MTKKTDWWSDRLPMTGSASRPPQRRAVSRTKSVGSKRRLRWTASTLLPGRAPVRESPSGFRMATVIAASASRTGRCIVFDLTVRGSRAFRSRSLAEPAAFRRRARRSPSAEERFVPWVAARSQPTAEPRGPDALVWLERSDGPHSVHVTRAGRPLHDRSKNRVGCQRDTLVETLPGRGSYNRPVVEVAPVHATANPPTVGESSSSSPPIWAGVASTIGRSVRCRKEKPPYFITETRIGGHAFRSSPDDCFTSLPST